MNPDHDWLLAPLGRSRNGQPVLSVRSKRTHWYQERHHSAGCGKSVEKMESDLDKVTCQQCLYVAWLDEEGRIQLSHPSMEGYREHECSRPVLW